jgi:hypothetical protein
MSTYYISPCGFPLIANIPEEIWKIWARRPHYPPDETAGVFSLPEISAPFRVRLLYFGNCGLPGNSQTLL